VVLFREAILHSHPKERQRTVDAPANRQDGNSAAKALSRRESPRQSAKRFSLRKFETISLLPQQKRNGFKNHSPLQEKGKNWFQSAPRRAGDGCNPISSFSCERRNGVARQRRKTLLASFLLAQTIFVL